MTLSATTKISRNPLVLSTSLGDEYVMMDIDSGNYFSLAAVSARIWDLLENSQTMAQLQAALIAEYEVDAAICQAELTDFISTALDAKIVQAG